VVFAEVEFFATVVARDGFPSLGGTGPELVVEAGGRDVVDFAVADEAGAELGVFAVEKEVLVKAFAGAEGEARTHDLGDAMMGRVWVLAQQAAGEPIGAEEWGEREGFFEEGLLAEDGPKGERAGA